MSTSEQDFWNFINGTEKTAEAVETNEKTPEPSGTTDPPLDNLERSPNDIDASWGQEPDRKIVPLGDSTVEIIRRGREGILKNLFGEYERASRTAQQDVKKQLANAASGNFASSSPLLTSASKEKLSSAETLLEQTARVTGRF